MLSVNSAELHRLLYNGYLFTRQKSIMGDAMRVHLSHDDLAIVASDDHVILMDKTDDVEFSDGRRSATFYFARKQLKEMIDQLAEMEGQVVLPTFFLEFDETKDFNGEIFSLIEEMRKEHGYQGDQHRLWALNRDRLRLLGLLKTPGDVVYPIDFNNTRSEVLERDVVQFKVGPTIRGFVAPLLRTETKIAEGLFESQC